MSSITPLYSPFDHQRPFLQYMKGGGKRAVLVWHRRAGKDLTAFNWTWVASQERVGIYYYFLPTYSQAKKVVWYGMDEEGHSFLNYIPQELVAKKHDTDMRVHMTNGSIIQLIGVDNIDSIVGTNPVGCVFSEYALQDPQGFRLISPILAKNGGWAVFCYTPRGRNHGYDLWENTRNNERWFNQLLTVEDTGLISQQQLDDERASGMPEELIQQEYYCSFSVTVAGAYFGRQMMQADEQGRIRELTYDPRLPVHTAWDIGVNDNTAIWFIQFDGRTVWAIDFYTNHNVGMDHYAEVLRSRGYHYGLHLFPHDVMKRGEEDAIPLRDKIERMGVAPIVVVKRISKIDQIQNGHMLIPRTIFCKVRCERGIYGLREYQREWDDKNKTHKNQPKHNWASHIADAYLVLACGIEHLEADDGFRPEFASGQFDPRTFVPPEQYDDFDPRSPLVQGSHDKTYISQEDNYGYGAGEVSQGYEGVRGRYVEEFQWR